jgi:DNA-binding NarL/FixJ family response regulator
VRNYVTRILSQLGLTSRTQAALFARSQVDDA